MRCTLGKNGLAQTPRQSSPCSFDKGKLCVRAGSSRRVVAEMDLHLPKLLGIASNREPRAWFGLSAAGSVRELISWTCSCTPPPRADAADAAVDLATDLTVDATPLVSKPDSSAGVAPRHRGAFEFDLHKIGSEDSVSLRLCDEIDALRGHEDVRFMADPLPSWAYAD